MARHAHSDPEHTGKISNGRIFLYRTRNGKSSYRASAPYVERQPQHDADGYYPLGDRNGYTGTENLISLYAGWDAALPDD